MNQNKLDLDCLALHYMLASWINVHPDLIDIELIEAFKRNS